MKSRVPFPFLDLSETQKTAVYHRIDFWQKFKLRLVARIFHQRPAHHLIIGTRFNNIYVETPRPEWIYRRLDPYNEIMITIDDGIGHTHLDVTVNVGHFGPPLGLVFLNMKNFSYYNARKSFESEGAELEFINRLLAPAHAQLVTFCYSSREQVGGGPIRDALDVLRWPFATGCMAETAEDFKTVLHAERQLARQPYRFSLQFGDNRTAWRAPLTDDEYGLIFAEVAHISELSVWLSRKGTWKDNTDIVVGILEAALVTHCPLPGVSRLLTFRMAFSVDRIGALTPKYQLPDKLRNLLKAQIGPNDEATAFRHTQFSEKNDSHEATRFDHIHIYVAQNRRGVGIEAVKVRNGYKLVKERDECVPIPWR